MLSKPTRWLRNYLTGVDQRNQLVLTNLIKGSLTRLIWRAEALVLSVAIVFGVLYAYGLWNLDFASFLSNVLLTCGAFVAFVVGAYALRKTGVGKDGYSRSWLLFASGVLSWFVAETIWAIYSIFLGIETPYPSIADGFWLVGYLPFFAALVLLALPFREAFASKGMALAIVATLISAVGVVVVLVPPILGSAGEQDLLTLIIGLAYPLLDVVLLVVGIPVLLLFREGIFWKPVSYVIIAIILNLVADILFAWAEPIGIYYTGHPIDLLYQWGYLAFALGFYLRLRQSRE